MKPGLSRAVPAAVLGFLGSMAFVFILRWLQSVEPYFEAEIAMVLAAFVSSAAFVWGMGGSNPRMSQHPHAPDVDEETGLAIYEEHDETAIVTEDEEIEEEARISHPTKTLAFSMWQVAYLLILLFAGLFAFATLPSGFYLRTATEAEASTADVGYYTTTLPFGIGEVQMSQLTAFVLLVIGMLLVMAAIAGGIALLFTSLSRNLQESQAEAPARLSYQRDEHLRRKPWRAPLIIAAGVIFVFIVFFYDLSTISNGTTLLLIAIAAALGIGLTMIRTDDSMDSTDQWIEAIRLNSMTAGLVFLFPTLYLLHYEVLVGYIIPADGIRELLSLGGALALTPLLTFVLFTDIVSEVVIGGARTLRQSLKDAEPDAPEPAEEPHRPWLPQPEETPQLDQPSDMQTAEANQS
jgi:hypothetical protein